MVGRGGCTDNGSGGGSGECTEGGRHGQRFRGGDMVPGNMLRQDGSGVGGGLVGCTRWDGFALQILSRIESHSQWNCGKRSITIIEEYLNNNM